MSLSISIVFLEFTVCVLPHNSAPKCLGLQIFWKDAYFPSATKAIECLRGGLSPHSSSAKCVQQEKFNDGIIDIRNGVRWTGDKHKTRRLSIGLDDEGEQNIRLLPPDTLNISLFGQGANGAGFDNSVFVGLFTIERGQVVQIERIHVFNDVCVICGGEYCRDVHRPNK